MKENYRKEVGKRLFAKRKEHNMTRAQIGAKLGLHESTVKRYEDGDIKSLDIEKLKEFADALHTNTAYLMGWDWDVINMDLSDMEAAVISSYRSQQDKQHIVNRILGVWDNPHPSDANATAVIAQMTLRDKYENLDAHGKDIVDTVLEKEYTRSVSIKETTEPEVVVNLPYAYDLAASAGIGEYAMDIAHFKTVGLTKSPPRGADFLVRISGDSMEPKYSNGDKVYIKRQDAISEGEIGLFYLDGNVYIKKQGYNELISLNPEYDPIPVTEYSTSKCFGNVLGKYNGDIIEL